MKLKILIPLVILILALLISAAVYFWPIKVDETIDGILFRSNIEQTEEQHVLEINGRYFRNIFRDNEFLGTFNIVGLNLPDGIDRTGTINIYLDHNNMGVLYYQNSESDWVAVGAVFWDIKDMKIAITVHEGAGTGSGQWSSADGEIFAAPATNRQDAIDITNDMMDSQLNKPIK